MRPRSGGSRPIFGRPATGSKDSGVESGHLLHLGAGREDGRRYRFVQVTWKPVSAVVPGVSVTSTGLGEVTVQLEATSLRETL